MKNVVLGLALGLALLPVAAAAQDGVKLDCVIGSLGTEDKQFLAKAMAAGGNDPAAAPLFRRVGVAAKGCMTRHNIPTTKAEIYLNYIAARIMRDWAMGEMANQKIPSYPIDTAFGFGANRTVPDLSAGITQAQHVTLRKAYRDSGIDLDSLSKDALGLIGSYAASTSTYWTKRAEFGS
jgi:hypothetical protein